MKVACMIGSGMQPYDHARANAQHERVRKAMENGMRDDLRFRRLVDSCVAEARREHGPVDPEHADRAAFEYATFAAAMLLARVYDEDGELAAMRAERDYYRDAALRVSLLTPAPFVMKADAP